METRPTLLVRGGRWPREKMLQNEGLQRASQGVFLLRVGEPEDADLLLTLAVAVFHAVGLDAWEGIAQGVPVDGGGDGAVVAVWSREPWTSSRRWEQRYRGCGALQGRSTHPYVRIRDVGRIAVSESAIAPTVFSLEEMASRIRHSDRNTSERFFRGESGRRTTLELDAWPCCSSLASEILVRRGWVELLGGERR